MYKTITRVKTKPINSGNGLSKTRYEVAEDGWIPSLLIEYEDGNKFLGVITGLADGQSDAFANKGLRFTVRQFMWNSVFERWDRTDSDKLNNGQLAVLNDFKVDLVTGKWQEEMTAEELSSATMLGEYDRWMQVLGESYIFYPLLQALEKKLTYEPPTINIT